MCARAPGGRGTPRLQGKEGNFSLVTKAGNCAVPDLLGCGLWCRFVVCTHQASLITLSHFLLYHSCGGMSHPQSPKPYPNLTEALRGVTRH